MNNVKHRFRDLDALIDRVHALFEQWEADGAFSPTLDADTLQLMKLAIHEWLANLIQHADFCERDPEIRIDVLPNGKYVQCVIEDNSEGFDLDLNLGIREAMLQTLPERGMGLLMLKACTEALSYRRQADGFQRLEFLVSAGKDPWLHIPF